MAKKISHYIPSFSKKYFEEYSDITKLEGTSLFMVRYDGLMIYHMNGLGDKLDSNSVGALLGGLWQAAQALSQFIPKTQTYESYRLSFDTSSQGLYVQPLTIKDDVYYLGLLYADEVNPAMLKSKLRILTFNFLKFLEDEIRDLESGTTEEPSDEYLFRDISDEEVDRLFQNVQL